MLESLFNKVAAEVYKKHVLYRTPPVATFGVFATKQLNIQCYNDNFGLYYNRKLSWKYCNYYHPPYIKISICYQKYAHLVQKFCSLSHLLFPTPHFLILSSIYFGIISIYLRRSDGVSHSYTVSLSEGLSKIDCPTTKRGTHCCLRNIPETIPRNYSSNIHNVNKNWCNSKWAISRYFV